MIMVCILTSVIKEILNVLLNLLSYRYYDSPMTKD